ncbi:transposase [Streptomyces sp. NPDC088116]|uniref:transposase n=1 Tax=Streptomyces sp. NPDC088116 TaxID=3365825 RepID=UPI003812F7E8
MKSASPAPTPGECLSCPANSSDIQFESRTEQQPQEWLSRSSLRAAIEGTINEFVNGHSLRQCRYRSEEKAHVQHILTAIVVNLERIGARLPPAPFRQPRNPTAPRASLTGSTSAGPGPGASPPALLADLIVLRLSVALRK